MASARRHGHQAAAHRGRDCAVARRKVAQAQVAGRQEARRRGASHVACRHFSGCITEVLTRCNHCRTENRDDQPPPEEARRARLVLFDLEARRAPRRRAFQAQQVDHGRRRLGRRRRGAARRRARAPRGRGRAACAARAPAQRRAHRRAVDQLDPSGRRAGGTGKRGVRGGARAGTGDGGGGRADVPHVVLAPAQPRARPPRRAAREARAHGAAVEGV